MLGQLIERTFQQDLCFAACSFLSPRAFRWLSLLAPTQAANQPSPPPPDFPLRVPIFCQTRLPANKTWKPVIEEKEVGLPPSSQQKTALLYLLSMAPGHLSRARSRCLQAPTPVPDQRVCRQAFVVMPVTLYMHGAGSRACSALRCLTIPLASCRRVCLNVPAGPRFSAQLESWFSRCG